MTFALEAERQHGETIVKTRRIPDTLASKPATA